MYRGEEKFLRGGGNLVVLSGNTMFWRVSFNDDGTVMECRKADAAGNRVPLARRGEAWHSQSAEDVLAKHGSVAAGLSAQEAAKRLAADGPNHIVRDARRVAQPRQVKLLHLAAAAHVVHQIKGIADPA